MRPHDMKYIGFKHQAENKQHSDNDNYKPHAKHYSNPSMFTQVIA
jgi:hypothetical protein